jgi:hypothetical protein
LLYRVGIVGPSPSVERILEVAKDFDQTMDLLTFPYTDSQLTERIVWENDHKVDAWLFSGRIPYMIAKQALGSDDNLVYIPHTGASLYKCFLNIAYAQGKLAERVSIDTLTSEDVTEVIHELGIPQSGIYLKAYKHDLNPDDLLQFHLDLWKNGQTEGAFTCFQATYLALQKEGIPVFWITPTRMTIRQTVHLLAEKITSLYFKDTQIGVEIIEIEHFDKVEENTNTPYDLQYLELRLKEMLIKLCEQLDGSLTERGNGSFKIFSTHGAIVRAIPMLRDTVLQISLAVGSKVAVGIGFGQTVFSAEINARRAVQQSKDNPAGGIVIFQEEGRIVESVGEEEESMYSARTMDPDVIMKLQQSSVGPKTFSKIQVLVRRMGWNGFTSKDLAVHLHMTERNARRIMAVLCEYGLAEVAGEESHTSRGRPSRIYKLFSSEKSATDDHAS